MTFLGPAPVAFIIPDLNAAPSCVPPIIVLLGSRFFLPSKSKTSATFSLPFLIILPALSFIFVIYLSSNS